MPTTFDELLQDTPTGTAPTFDSLIDEMQTDDRKRRLLQGQQSAKDIDPARQAEAIRIGRDKGVPTDIAYEDLEELRDGPSVDFDALLRDAPATADILGDPVKGPVAFPDAAPLADAEKTLRNLTDFVKKLPPKKPEPVDPVFGFGMLTPEERVIEQQRLIQIYAEEKRVAEEAKRQADMTVEAERQFREANDPNYAYAGENRRETLTEIEADRQVAGATKALKTVVELAPTMTRIRNWTDTAARGTLQFGTSLPAGIMALGDALETLMPTGTVALDAQGKSAATRLFDEIDETIAQAFPGDRARDPEFMTKFTQGLTSMAGFLLTGMAARAAGVSSAWATVVTGGAVGAREGEQDAASNNATPQQKALATLVGALAGTSEVIPVESWFRWADASGGPWLVRVLASAITNAAIEGGQETAQGLSLDLLARYTYDPERDILTNMGENFTVGGAVGGFFGMIAGIRSKRPRETADQLKALGDAVNKTGTSQIMPEILEEQIANLKKMDAAPEAVTAPLEALQTLFQEMSEVDLAAKFSDIVTAMNEARETGAEVTIPTERLPALAALEGYKTFTDFVRVAPEEMTVVEQEATKKEVEKFLSEVDTEQVRTAPDQSPVYQNIRQQLIAAGQSPEAAQAQARLYDSVFTNLSERTGVAVDTLVRRYGFEVTSSEVDSLGIRLNQLTPGENTAPKNMHGFEPKLRVKAPELGTEVEKPPKALFTQETTNKNAEVQIGNLDITLGQFPSLVTEEDWARMLSYALKSDEVPAPPFRFINEMQNLDTVVETLGKLTPGQVKDADHGFENASKLRTLYTSGKVTVENTGKLFLWSFLSRGVSPYTQESLFLDAFNGIDEWISKAARGELTKDDMPDFKAWASKAAPKGSGQPGAGATHNLNAFGSDFLIKMGQKGPDGKTPLLRLHEMMSDPAMTGQQIRREFLKFGQGVGIDNKVVSFTLLVAGLSDVMVLDRVQVRRLWNDGRFGDRNLYDPLKNENGDAITGTALSEITYGARGLLVYEAIERELAKRLPEIYGRLGRAEAASVGRYHWETWVADSQQEASHGTLDAVLRQIKGDNAPTADLFAKQGEYGAYEYGARYGRTVDGTPVFEYTVPEDGTYTFPVPQFRAFLEAVKKPANKVVPTKFKVSENASGPWYNRPEVNRAALAKLAAQFGSRTSGGDVRVGVRQDPAADAGGGSEGRTLYQSSRFEQQLANGREAFRALQSLRTAEGPGRGNWVERGRSEAAGAGLSGLKTYEPSPQAAAVYQQNNLPSLPIVEHRAADFAAQFHSAISASKQASKFGAAVYVYSAEEYAGMRLFTTEDGSAGFAIKPDGDIVSVFSNGQTPNLSYSMLHLAVEQGGTKLDAFDTVLPKIYAAAGFEETGRDLWNEQYKPEGWDYETFKAFNDGRPDVVYMEYRGATADQKLEQDAKGFITFSPARDKFKVTLTGKADLSTFLHESGHFFLEVLQDLVARGEASAQQVADLATLRQWMSAAENKPFEVKQHEQFARGFEAYLMEGKAPSMALARVFQTFKAWLVFVYRRLSGLNVSLTDDVRSVLDRLVASDEAIAEARAQVGWRGSPMPQDATGLTDGEYKAYTEAWAKASDAQSMDADARVMQEAARELKKAWRDEKIKRTKEAEAALAKTQGYRAWKALETGEGLDDVSPGRTSLKIDPASVPKEWGNDARGLTGEGGMPLDTVAEILGFSSGETMLSHVAGAKAAQKAIPLKVKAQMQEVHGSMDDAALATEAAKAVHNKPTMDVLLTEYRALSNKAGVKTQKNISAFLAAQAEERVAQLTQRQLDPVKWRRAELKAAQEAGKLAGQRKHAEAALAKRRQLMAAAMNKASLDAIDRIEKIKDYLSTFQTDRRRAQLGKAGDLYLDGIDQILEGVEFKDRSLKTLNKRKTLQEIVDQAIAADEPVNIPPEVLDTARLKNYSQMTMAELEGVHDAVKNLWTLAKLKNTLKARQQKLELDRTIDQIDAAARANLPAIRKTDTLNPGVIDRLVNGLRWSRAQLVKMEFLTGWIDGQPDGGLFHRVFYQPIADARALEYKLMKEMSRDITEKIRNMPREQRVRWDTKRNFMNLPNPIRGANIIAVALNLGNEGNKTKLLQGYGWDAAQLKTELDAFMTKADWDVVQHIWNTIDKLWPRIEQVSRSATGLPPERIVPSSVETPYGEYAGGYYPVVYDPYVNRQQRENQEKNASANGLFQNNFLKPSLANGFTKKRTGYTAPLLLSLDVLSNHLAETIHYVTHYEAVKQADKIRSHPKFEALINETFGKEFHAQIRPWLQDIANNVTQRRLPELGEVIMRRVRTGMSISTMGYNLGTGIKQMFGVTTALDAIGPRYWAQGIYKSWFSPSVAKNWRFALENSQELEPLIRDFDRDIKQINDAYAAKLAGGSVDWLVRNAFTHIGYLQLVVNVSTWQGGYEQAIAGGKTHRQAVDHADSVVRKTQSSGSVKDLANVQRSSEATKMLTMFYSYMSIVYNRLEDINQNTRSIKDVPYAATRLAIMLTLPALLELGYQAAYDALTGGDDDDDDAAPFHVQLMVESANTALGSVPLVRDAIDLKGFGPSSPLVRTIEQFHRTAGAFRDLMLEGEEPSRSEIRAAVSVVSTVTHIPGSAIYKLVDDLVNGQITPNNR